ncbi:MAG: desulfoferrodoxin family protein [Desulfosalsimonadaceae bacterium]
MKKIGTVSLYLGALFMAGFFGSPAVFANESAVEIEAPTKAKTGEEIIIVLHVSHDGNNFLHHTNRVELRINGEMVKEWEYGTFSKPEAEDFSVSFSYPTKQDLEIEAEAFCNLHGSKNTDAKTVSVEDAQSNGNNRQ